MWVLLCSLPTDRGHADRETRSQITIRAILPVFLLTPSTDVIQLTLTLKMTTAQVVETSVTVNNNSPTQDYVHPDDQTQPFEMTPGFKPFTTPCVVVGLTG